MRGCRTVAVGSLVAGLVEERFRLRGSYGNTEAVARIAQLQAAAGRHSGRKQSARPAG